MANLNDLFPSKFLKASDLQGQVRRVTIQQVSVEEIAQGEHKPVIHFIDAPKPLVLNKTNGQLLGSLFGMETDAWGGKKIEIYSEKVAFQGRIVDAIRVRQLAPPTAVIPGVPDQPEPRKETAATEAAAADDVIW
jgi:hypothetical protein